jgi:hypothetical protein
VSPKGFQRNGLLEKDAIAINDDAIGTGVERCSFLIACLPTAAAAYSFNGDFGTSPFYWQPLKNVSSIFRRDGRRNSKTPR